MLFFVFRLLGIKVDHKVAGSARGAPPSRRGGRALSWPWLAGRWRCTECCCAPSRPVRCRIQSLLTDVVLREAECVSVRPSTDRKVGWSACTEARACAGAAFRGDDEMLSKAAQEIRGRYQVRRPCAAPRRRPAPARKAQATRLLQCQCLTLTSPSGPAALQSECKLSQSESFSDLGLGARRTWQRQ